MAASPAICTSIGPSFAFANDFTLPNLRSLRASISCAGSLRRARVPKMMAEGKYICSRDCPDLPQKAFQKAWTWAATCSAEIVGISNQTTTLIQRIKDYECTWKQYCERDKGVPPG